MEKQLVMIACHKSFVSNTKQSTSGYFYVFLISFCFMIGIETNSRKKNESQVVTMFAREISGT